MKYIKLFKDSLEVFDTLTDEQTGLLFKAIIDYSNDKEPKLDGLLSAVFFQFKQQIDRAKTDYVEVCNRNKANGSKGGRKKPTGTHSVNEEPKQSQEEDKEEDKDKEENKLFTFSLKTSRLLSSTSKEYQSNLKDYIETSGKPMSYQDFYNQCEMKPYKYKNFKMAYDSWNKKSTAVATTQKSFKQLDKERASSTVDTYMNNDFNLREHLASGEQTETVEEIGYDGN